MTKIPAKPDCHVSPAHRLKPKSVRLSGFSIFTTGWGLAGLPQLNCRRWGGMLSTVEATPGVMAL